MPLLLLPVLLVGLVLLWLLLLPLLLLQRYRLGRTRQRAVGWMAGANAWLLLLSAMLLLAGAWLGQRWIADGLSFTAAGLAAGLLLGLLGVRLSTFEATAKGLFHTPNHWLVVLLTLAVAVRIALGLWQGWLHVRAGGEVHGLLAEQGSLFALGALLLGYHLAYAWGLRRALRAPS
ncbi:MAG: DUF1453 domain-containing protein [Pseudomonadota bacterium]